MRAHFLPGVFCCAMGIAPSIQACGDKLVGLGGGVPFARIHPAHYAGQIVLFARRDSGLQSFNERAHLSHRLERSGHTVRLIDNDKDLDGALRANPMDLVLAEPADATALRTRFTGDSAAPLVLAVVTETAGTASAQPAASSCVLQASLSQGKSVVRTLERFITSRHAGTVINCAATGERS